MEEYYYSNVAAVNRDISKKLDNLQFILNTLDSTANHQLANDKFKVHFHYNYEVKPKSRTTILNMVLTFNITYIYPEFGEKFTHIIVKEDYIYDIAVFTSTNVSSAVNMFSMGIIKMLAFSNEWNNVVNLIKGKTTISTDYGFYINPLEHYDRLIGKERDKNDSFYRMDYELFTGSKHPNIVKPKFTES